jgi:hypothetical protein
LSDTLPTQRLASLERLALESSQGIEDGSNQQEDSCDNQAGRLGPDADPLYGAHDEVDGGAHVVGAEFPDKGVELGRGRADAEEERDFDEDDDEGAYSVQQVSHEGRSRSRVGAYKQTMLNAITKLAWKMLAIPSAKQRNMHSTPVLRVQSVNPLFWYGYRVRRNWCGSQVMSMHDMQ